jgi:hypothetical protein
MALFLERVDAAPLSNTDFSFEFMQWLSVLVDQMNEVLATVQDNLNFNTAQSYTTAEITALASDLPDGCILYNSTTNVYVGKENGTLRTFTTAAYP